MSERTEGEQEREKCPGCGAERIGCNMGTWGDAYECGSYSCGHRSDTCRIRERDAALSTIREKLGLPPDTPPAKVAEEAGRVIRALPKTADGVRVVPGMEIRHPDGRSGIASIEYTGRGGFPSRVIAGQCYSTLTAAEAARGEGAESEQSQKGTE